MDIFSDILTENGEWTVISMLFMGIFIVFLAIYLYIKSRNTFAMQAYVLLFSLLFAWKASGILMVLLPTSAIMSWLLTENIRQSRGRERKLWLTFTIIAELAPLLYFKYSNFFIDILNDMTQSNFSPLSLVLPVGISFYTFQTVSYTVDVYRRRFNMRATLLEYLFYISFFPLLMAGPITRAGTLIPQLRKGKEENSDGTLAYTGLWLLMLGVMKKVVVADYLAQFNDWIFESPTTYSGFENLMGVLGYTLQIYCDFSGYTDISIGMAALMGIKLRENFRTPYQAVNVTEFWHRWHIALSTWFRDYLYIPLGGNRCGKVRTLLNNFITMVAAGLWHGASMMFVIWGALHGAALVIHKLCRCSMERLGDAWFVRLLSWGITFAFICFTWVFFRSPSMEVATTILRQIATDFDISYLIPFLKTRPLWSLILITGFAFHAIKKRHHDWLKQRFIDSPWAVKLLLMIIVAQLVINMSQNSVRPFIYAQF